MKKPLLMLFALAPFFTPGTAKALEVAGEAMTSWSGCDCSAGSLKYTDDQISYLISEMQDLGHQKKFFYKNTSSYSLDLIEDSLPNGYDAGYADGVDLFALSSHGGAPNDSNGKQTFSTPMCKSGSASASSSCHFDANQSRMGEAAGPGQSQYATPHPGQARWWVFFTCYSVHTKPNEQWGQTLAHGGDTVLGYRGTSADSFTTDEVGEDLVDAVFDDGDTLKGGWFWAAEDWAVDDVASMVASGKTRDAAIYRRDKAVANWERRGSDSHHGWFAWAWHEG
ncbi:DUF6345 domain-containing protein [Pendulispora brunnea]|uniref:DUF6345 domain-containing protein n=1 Tax=Pendulispora brunnea TaxID=2905690 RepID=A0ABZ2K7F1_9BACT